MTTPLVVSIPHRLGKQEAVRRLRTGLSQARTSFGHLMSLDEEVWNGDSLTFRVRALGQSANGTIDVAEDHLRLEVSLPWLLAKLSERLAPAIRKEGTLLLEKNKNSRQLISPLCRPQSCANCLDIARWPAGNRWGVRMARIKDLFAACCVVVVLALSSQSAFPQSGRTIHLVVPVPPGASTDAVARLMAEQIGRAQGVTIVVENRPGASGMIGTEAVSRAAPDGNTLLMTANTYLIDAQTRKANYHPVTAFDPICYLVQSPAVFVVNSASPYKTLKDLLDAARAKPGELTMAAVGPGSTFQMGFTTFTRAANVQMTYVPYQGSAPAATAVLGQHVTSAFAGYAVVSENVKADKLRALAVATMKRIEPLPDVPTFDESGFKNLEVDNWFGIIAPVNTPKETINQFAGWLKTALQDPEVKAKLALQGLYPVGICGDEFAAYIRKRYDDYGEMIKQSNIKAQ